MNFLEIMGFEYCISETHFQSTRDHKCPLLTQRSLESQLSQGDYGFGGIIFKSGICRRQFLNLCDLGLYYRWFSVTLLEIMNSQHELKLFSKLEFGTMIITVIEKGAKSKLGRLAR